MTERAITKQRAITKNNAVKGAMLITIDPCIMSLIVLLIHGKSPSYHLLLLHKECS